MDGVYKMVFKNPFCGLQDGLHGDFRELFLWFTRRRVNTNLRYFYVAAILFTISTLTCAQTTLRIPKNAIEDLSTINITTEHPTTPGILEKWENWEKSAKKRAADIIKWVLPFIMEDSSMRANITGSCIRDGMKLVAGIRRTKTWAFSFIDASGKATDGMLLGAMSAFGDYDQCVATEAIDERRGKNNGKVMFTGKYCALDIKPPLPPKKNFYKLSQTIEELKNFSKGTTVIRDVAKSAQMFYFLSIRYGVCVPSGCQESDVQHVANRLSERSNLLIKVSRCELKAEKKYSASIIAVITVSSFLGLLVLIGSIIDIYYYYTGRKIKGVPIEMLIAFSFISNFKRLVNTDVSNESLSCFSGMRVFSITWIILGHTYLNINFQLFRQLRYTIDYAKDFAFTAVVNASVAVDTFFVMGGFLVCYLTLKIMEETKKPFSIILYIVHRLIRILPLYMMVVAFMFLHPLFGYGPVWHDTTDKFTAPCYSHWWSNFLFINNYFRPDQMCLTQTWYVACDMQLYIAALIILLPLIRWPKIGLSVAGFGILASIITSGTITYVMEFPPTMLFIHPDHDQRLDYWSLTYFKPYPHIGPYCIGMLLGYFVATQPKRHLSLRTRIVGWCLAVACNLAVLYGVYDWNSGRDPILLETILYSSCHRVAWALGVSWVIYNCATGQGGVVNYILSWKCWTVLARLTYGAYLIHPIVQITAIGNFRVQLQPWQYFAVWIYFGHLAITYGCAFAATMLVEAPFLALGKVLFRKQTKTIRKESGISNDLEINHGLGNNESRRVSFSSVQTNNENESAFSKSGIKNKTFTDDHEQISRL